jgi:voltage-gated potassium channel
MNQQTSLRHLRIAIILVLSVIALGIAGYMLIERLSFADALYTTIDIMSTIGNITRPLSANGRLFTIAITILGVGSLFYTLGATTEFMIEGHLSKAIGRRIMDRKIAALRKHYVICGYGRVGSQIAEEIAAARKPFVVIDENEANIQHCMQKGYLALQGNASRDSILRAAGIQYAQVLFVATDQDAINLYITLSARNLNPGLFIIARANEDETVAKLKLAGADRVLSPYAIGGHRMANLALQPTVVDFFDSLINAEHPGIAVQEVPLPVNSPLIGKTLVDAQKMMGEGTMILALKKPGGLVIGNRPEIHIDEGDAVILVGAPEQLAIIARNTSA